MVHPSLGVGTLDELITLVRANPGRCTYASGGAGAQPHLAFEQFRLSLGLDIVHVPFGGAGPAVASIVAGHTPVGVSSLPPCVPHIQEGGLRALVLSSKKRSQKLPDIPTAEEAGYPVLTGDQWVEFLVPAETPDEIVSLLHRSIVDITKLSDVKEHLDTLDFYEDTQHAPGVRRADQGRVRKLAQGGSGGSHQSGVTASSDCAPLTDGAIGPDWVSFETDLSQEERPGCVP